MNAIIIDDESNNIENLKILLHEHCDEVSIVGTATDTYKAESLIRERKPDIVFLDIQIPERNGFELLATLGDASFEIIFVTGFDKYAIQAVRFAALDYLLKPIVIDDLKNAVQKASKKILEKRKNNQLENLLYLLKQEKIQLSDKIALPSTRETRFVKVSTILYCESQNNYTTFFLSDGEKLLVSKPIYEYEELLEPYGFIRNHNSYLVNKAYIKSFIKTDGGGLLLENDTILPIARTKKDLIRKSLL